MAVYLSAFTYTAYTNFTEHFKREISNKKVCYIPKRNASLLSKSVHGTLHSSEGQTLECYKIFVIILL